MFSKIHFGYKKFHLLANVGLKRLRRSLWNSIATLPQPRLQTLRFFRAEDKNILLPNGVAGLHLYPQAPLAAPAPAADFGVHHLSLSPFGQSQGLAGIRIEVLH